ncbi:V0D/AC39 family V-type ATPase subunit [Blautia hydrogenotrophica]|uniref:V0D/AC39 family V-type ATPase subunit n=1 Tax=Blautia hydrogenotrophica TaxID=53443 RepID=UPI003A84A9ED
MYDEQYTYAVARIRARETTLFSQATINQLMACKDEAQCLQFLIDKGWGDMDTPVNAEAILTREREKTWELMRELVDDMSVFDVLTYSNLFHNLKAAIKEVATEEKNPNIFFNDCAISGEEMMEIISEKNFSKLPKSMSRVAEEAYETFLHTRDGQLCDIMVDKAALEAIYEAGKRSDAEIIRDYAESTVAVADIKIAVRSQKTAKTMEFMKRAMAECDSISVDQLSRAALSGMDAIQEYLSGTVYAEGAQALAESASAFERWCDNRIIQTIHPQLYNPFTIGPLVAYILARENEIKTVRIILTGKLNQLSDEFIRERIREMYV